MIITLPMTPRIQAPVGYWLTPVMASILAKQRREKLAIFAGTLGMQTIDDTTIASFRDGCKNLLIDGELSLDRDHESALSVAVVSLLTTAEKEGRLKELDIESFVCDCGALEIPVSAVDFLKEKTFFSERGSVHCKKCLQETERKNRKKLMLFFRQQTIDFFERNVHVVPKFYSKELQNLTRQLKTYGVPVSKNRETGVNYKRWSIDIEFLIAHIGAVVHEPGTLVATNHVLRQALVTSLVDIESDSRSLRQILFLPYLIYPGNKEKWQLARLFASGHDAHTVRFMLASSIRWQQKNCTLEDFITRTDYVRFTAFKRLTEGVTPQLPRTLELFIENVNFHNCSQGLTQVFKKQGFDYSTLHGL